MQSIVFRRGFVAAMAVAMLGGPVASADRCGASLRTNAGQFVCAPWWSAVPLPRVRTMCVPLEERSQSLSGEVRASAQDPLQNRWGGRDAMCQPPPSALAAYGAAQL